MTSEQFEPFLLILYVLGFPYYFTVELFSYFKNRDTNILIGTLISLTIGLFFIGFLVLFAIAAVFYGVAKIALFIISGE